MLYTNQIIGGVSGHEVCSKNRLRVRRTLVKLVEKGFDVDLGLEAKVGKLTGGTKACTQSL